ncbi:MAG: hypothetical protein BGO39_03470 [Chloroflexi bacterium 54-19]|nr:MAG: hypothetical protein BGO39_03470 [Chloroflexi bacterium 54-19]
MIILSRLKVTNYKSLKDIDLSFPRQASILIEGLNEAGKSTLFETVYFALYGEPLVTEEGNGRAGGRIESAINYQASKAIVILELEISETILKINRTLHRGRTTEATLTIIRPGLPAETVSTQTAVNRRVVQELGGLDKEALLNSCFVEQKKLDRLEQLGTADRRATLERLLNLDKLQYLQEQFKVSRQAEEEVRQAEYRLQLAQLQASLPLIERNLAETRLKLTAIELLIAFANITAQEEYLRNLRARQQEIQSQLKVLDDQLVKVKNVREVREVVVKLSYKVEEIERLEKEAVNLEEDLAGLDYQENVLKPDLEKRQEALIKLYEDLEELASRQSEKDALLREGDNLQSELRNITERENQLTGITRDISREESELNDLTNRVSAEEKEAEAGVAEQEPRLEKIEKLLGFLTDRANLQRELNISLEKEHQSRDRQDSFERLSKDTSQAEEDVRTCQSEVDAAEINYQEARRTLNAGTEIEALEKLTQGFNELNGQGREQAELADANRSVLEATQSVAAQQKVFDAGKTKIGLTGGLAGAAGLLGLVCIVVGFTPGAVFLLIAIILGIISASQVSTQSQRRRQLEAARSSLEAAKQSEIQLKAASAARAATGGSQFRNNEAHVALKQLGASIPQNYQQAIARLNILRQDLPGRLDITLLRQEVETALTKKAQADQHLAAARATWTTKQELLKTHPGFGQTVLELEKLESTGQAAQINDLTRLIQALGNDLDLPLEQGQPQAEGEMVRAHLTQLNNQLAGIPPRRDTIKVRRQHLSGMQQEQTNITNWLTQHNRTNLESQMAGNHQRIKDIEHFVAGREPLIEKTATGLEVRPVASDIQQMLGTVNSKLSRISQELANRPAIKHKKEDLMLEISHRHRGALQTWQNLLPLPQGVVFEESTLPSSKDYKPILNSLEGALNQLNEAETTNRRQNLGQQLGQLASDTNAVQRNIEEQQKFISETLVWYGLQFETEFEKVSSVFPLLNQVQIQDKEDLKQQENQLEIDLHLTDRKIKELAVQLNIIEMTLDVEECSAELASLKYELEVRRKAVFILDGVRRTMVEKVLPGTISYMRLLLPVLTMDRYRDCNITSDYKIQVWDELAGRYVAKNIFSGGTRDQFSLALRLSFALATLPENLGSTPGFIFLDEPLSSFDDQRSEALVNLLTNGEIAQKFSQIFVISHNRMFNEQSFTHRILIEGGRVAGQNQLKSGQTQMEDFVFA